MNFYIIIPIFVTEFDCIYFLFRNKIFEILNTVFRKSFFYFIMASSQ